MKLAWAVSGRGMGARAVMEAHRAGLLRSKLDHVIFDRLDGTESMTKYCDLNGVPHSVVSPSCLSAGMIKVHRDKRIDWMGLTFNWLVPQDVIDEFNGKIFNLHMSLLPMFPGFGALRKALQSGIPHTGVTVHLIDGGVDSGPIIAQQSVNILSGDDEASLGRRQFEASVPLLLQTVRLAENGADMHFDHADFDLIEFGSDYCAQIRSLTLQAAAG